MIKLQFDQFHNGETGATLCINPYAVEAILENDDGSCMIFCAGSSEPYWVSEDLETVIDILCRMRTL